MFTDFVIENWYLFALLVVIIGMLIAEPIIRQASGVKSVSVLEMPQLTRDKSIIVDVSEPVDYKKSHIPDAVNIPAKSLSKDPKPIEKHKNKNVILVCRMGNKSQSVAKQLLKNGFEKVYVVSGGMAAWQKENLPVKRG
jgi:rhodanese-related sulfurtransferase